MHNKCLKSSGFCSTAEEPSEPAQQEARPEFSVEELLRWLYKREGEMESKKERTKDVSKKAKYGCQAKAYKDVQNYIEQRKRRKAGEDQQELLTALANELAVELNKSFDIATVKRSGLNVEFVSVTADRLAKLITPFLERASNG